MLKERERAKREAEVEADRIARVKEMEAAMERLRKVRREEGWEQLAKEHLARVLRGCTIIAIVLMM